MDYEDHMPTRDDGDVVQYRCDRTETIVRDGNGITSFQLSLTSRVPKPDVCIHCEFILKDLRAIGRSVDEEELLDAGFGSNCLPFLYDWIDVIFHGAGETDEEPEETDEESEETDEEPEETDEEPEAA
jgi:hypothetical protein